MVTLEEVLVTSVRWLEGAEGAIGREEKGVSQLQSVAYPEQFVKRRGGGRYRKGMQSMEALSVAVFLHEKSTTFGMRLQLTYITQHNNI